MNKPVTPTLQQFEATRQKLEALKNRKTRIQVQMEAARQQYQTAAAEAEAQYGTRKLPELKTMLANQEAANKKALDEFISAVSDFESYLSKIEQALENPEAMTALLASMGKAAATTPTQENSEPAPATAMAFDEDQI